MNSGSSVCATNSDDHATDVTGGRISISGSSSGASGGIVRIVLGSGGRRSRARRREVDRLREDLLAAGPAPVRVLGVLLDRSDDLVGGSACLPSAETGHLFHGSSFHAQPGTTWATGPPML